MSWSGKLIQTLESSGNREYKETQSIRIYGSIDVCCFLPFISAIAMENKEVLPHLENELALVATGWPQKKEL